MKVVIIDYGVGNTASVESAFVRLGCKVEISNQEDVLKQADLLVLPGVGAFKEAMGKIIEKSLKPILNELVLEKKKPILGICLGMQLMATESYEDGYCEGLNWIPGKVDCLGLKTDLCVPHVGWNDVSFKKHMDLFERVQVESDMYFDHSFHYMCDNQEDILAEVDYGFDCIAAINKGNIWGVQFHPEKSQLSGLRLLRVICNEVKHA